MPSYAHAATQHRRYDSFRHRSRLHRAFQEQLHGFLRPDCSLRSDSQPAPPNRNPIDLTASAANASGSVQTTLSKLPRPHRPVIPTLLLRGSPDRDLSFMRTQLISCRLPKADSALLRSWLFHHLCRFVSVSSGGLASARESLSRGLGSRWFTKRFHRNALVTHLQHGQVFCAARRLENYAVARCRLHQRAPQR